MIPYLWYRSTRDELVHAFPAAQAAEAGRTWLEAKCEHTVPPSEVVKDDTGGKCMGCLLLVGHEIVQAGGEAPSSIGYVPGDVHGGGG